MKGLRFTEETRKVALVFFTFFFVYGLINTPVVQFLVCLAVAAIVQGVSDSYEIALVAFLLMNYIYPMFSRRSVAGYSNKMYASANANSNANSNANANANASAESSASEGFVDVSAITSRIKNMVTGVGSPLTEGFADASDNDLTLNKSGESENSSDVTASSKPASANTSTSTDAKADVKADASEDKNAQLAKMTQMMSSVLKNMGDKTTSPSEDAHAPPAATKISEQNVPAVTQPAESFTDNGGLFKLGQIPTEAKGGFHIDAGTTVMNAINALKPDQIKAMTQDTKQLIDTQKSLMGMLQTFQPMVQEGKQMMDTFQTMFSPSMGAK